MGRLILRAFQCEMQPRIRNAGVDSRRILRVFNQNPEHESKIFDKTDSETFCIFGSSWSQSGLHKSDYLITNVAKFRLHR